MHFEHGPAQARGLVVFGAAARKGLDFHPGHVRQLGQAFLEVQAVDAAVKINEIARGLTTETVKESFIFIDGKRRLGFAVERAGRHPAPPAGVAQLHVFFGDIQKTQPGFNRLGRGWACACSIIHTCTLA